VPPPQGRVGHRVGPSMLIGKSFYGASATSTSENTIVRKENIVGAQPERCDKQTKNDWFRTHTSNAALLDTLHGNLMDDGSGCSGRLHKCTNPLPGGLPCHVGLYGLDPSKSEEILRQHLNTFLDPKKSYQDRGREAFAGMSLSDDGTGLGAPMQCDVHATMHVAPNEKTFGILVNTTDDGAGTLVSTVSHVFGGALIQTPLTIGDVLVAAHGTKLPTTTGVRSDLCLRQILWSGASPGY
jgi:hypothetical protein